jgi:hypothetical protein
MQGSYLGAENIRGRGGFWDLKTFRFPSKSRLSVPAAFLERTISSNIYGAIMIFTGFFPGTPLPTPVF